MTEIKCRYRKPYCSGMFHGERKVYVVHDEIWWCDSNFDCEFGRYTKPPNADVINPQCVYLEHDVGEFATTVKRYSWENGELRVGNRILDENEITYLEIDGRVVID